MTTADGGVPADAAVEAADLERALRHALATSPEASAPALELMGLLCALERHAEALGVVLEAQKRSTDPTLQVAKAGLLRDLGRRHLAVQALRELLRDHGAIGLHPSLLFELAELEWLEGKPEASKGVLATLEAVHGVDPWCCDNRRSLEALTQEMQRTGSPSRVRVRDLLGNLRGAATVVARIRALEELAVATIEGDEAAGADLHQRAIAIAGADESPSVRARAVQLACLPSETGAIFCRTALNDAAAIVRWCAAARAPEWLGPAGIPLLLDHLANEDDAAAFTALHGALAKLSPPGPTLPRTGLDGATARAGVVKAWRDQCGL
ncbi:MAG: hypothetical protein ABIP94_23400 [Planctomycetota bacterium]